MGLAASATTVVCRTSDGTGASWWGSVKSFFYIQHQGRSEDIVSYGKKVCSTRMIRPISPLHFISFHFISCPLLFHHDRLTKLLHPAFRRSIRLRKVPTYLPKLRTNISYRRKNEAVTTVPYPSLTLPCQSKLIQANTVQTIG